MPTQTSSEKIQEWEEKIQQQKASGLPIAKWCEQHHVSYHTFNYWRERLGHVQPLRRTSFKELTDSKEESGIFIEKKGVRIHIAKHFDAATLTQCLKTLC